MIQSGRRSLRLTQTADVLRVRTGAKSADDRETVIDGLAVSGVYPASTEQAERAGMATAARMLVVYTAPVTVQTDWRLLLAGEDYRIRAVSGWPVNDPQFMELLIEKE